MQSKIRRLELIRDAAAAPRSIGLAWCDGPVDDGPVDYVVIARRWPHQPDLVHAVPATSPVPRLLNSAGDVVGRVRVGRGGGVLFDYGAAASAARPETPRP